MLEFFTAGESHGPGLVVIINGIPAGLSVSKDQINQELMRRQQGAGRGGRMKIEKDQAEILSGIRFGKTIGSPIAMVIRNQDWENWISTMSQDKELSDIEVITQPRPGHADFAGLLKTGQKDIRNILERASARETACRVAAGAVAKRLLREMKVTILSHVVRIGTISASYSKPPRSDEYDEIEGSEVRCLDIRVSEQMKREIERAKEARDSLGGVFEVIAYGVPPGLGSYAKWDQRLDGRLARALMSIPAIKAVEIGDGLEASQKRGSDVHDEIFYNTSRRFYRKTNRAGGIEGGMTNGELVILRACMKPIPTLTKPLKTVDMVSKKTSLALKERADICAVPAAGVIGEAMVAIELASAMIEKFGGDCMEDIICNYENYLQRIQNFYSQRS